MSMRITLLAPLALAGVALLGSTAVAQTNPGEQLFKQRCQACHVVKPDLKPGPLGPNLRGVVGRKAATTAYKTHSPALKKANLTWTRANLDKYLAAPAKMVPGTKMVVALPDAKQRATLLDYLATLK